MLDMQVSNNKLFYRGIAIVSVLAGVPHAEAKIALLRAIHDSDGTEGQQVCYGNGTMTHCHTAS